VVNEYVGGFDDWLRQRPQPAEDVGKAAKPMLVQQTAPAKASAQAAPAQAGKPRKLSFKEQRELENLRAELVAFPARIEALEQGIAAASESLANPELYKKAPKLLTATRNELSDLESELEQAFARWEAAEARAKELDPAG